MPRVSFYVLLGGGWLCLQPSRLGCLCLPVFAFSHMHGCIEPARNVLNFAQMAFCLKPQKTKKKLIAVTIGLGAVPTRKKSEFRWPVALIFSKVPLVPLSPVLELHLMTSQLVFIASVPQQWGPNHCQTAKRLDAPEVIGRLKSRFGLATDKTGFPDTTCADFKTSVWSSIVSDEPSNNFTHVGSLTIV